MVEIDRGYAALELRDTTDGDHAYTKESDEAPPDPDAGGETEPQSDVVLVSSEDIVFGEDALYVAQTWIDGVDEWTPLTPERLNHIEGGIYGNSVSIKDIRDCLSQKADQDAVNTALASKAATDHKHSAADITTGTLSVNRGGTGVTTAAGIGIRAYPVGALYLSFVSTSPASLFGGTWQQITGRVLRAASDTNTGGSDSVTLTVTQMPQHRHYLGRSSEGGGRNDWGLIANGAFGGGVALYWSMGLSSGIMTTEMGNGGAHSNMQAYQNIFVWRRTA